MEQLIQFKCKRTCCMDGSPDIVLYREGVWYKVSSTIKESSTPFLIIDDNGNRRYLSMGFMEKHFIF